ncbi:MAG: phosphopeptide-binding protein [Nocardioides sp.]|nr:phosphopeptide-binding protein [Nocardioides sp.]
MSVVCPAGHDSDATDYCDTCGAVIDPAQQSSTPAAPAPSPAPSSFSGPDASAAGECPSCGAAHPPAALFCESCGYDFTTGTMPRPVDPTPLTPPVPAAASAPSPPAASSPSPGAPSGNPSPPPAEPWVAEVWIDPDWYADQESTDPLPSPGLPTVVVLRHRSNLIGRSSRSRGIDPELDLGSDHGISRRHAQLTTDGTRWFVEDLGSSNGTYVGDAGGPLPVTPLAPGQKTEITDDSRIYLGAWTRVVLRRAAPGEA